MVTGVSQIEVSFVHHARDDDPRRLGDGGEVFRAHWSAQKLDLAIRLAGLSGGAGCPKPQNGECDRDDDCCCSHQMSFVAAARWLGGAPLVPDRDELVDGPDIPHPVDQRRRSEGPRADVVGMEELEHRPRLQHGCEPVVVGHEELVVDDDR